MTQVRIYSSIILVGIGIMPIADDQTRENPVATAVRIDLSAQIEPEQPHFNPSG